MSHVGLNDWAILEAKKSGIWKVSEEGEVWSRHNRAGRLLPLGEWRRCEHPARTKRRRVLLCGKTVFISRVVWIWFRGEIVPRTLEVDHIDENKRNDRLSNLQLLTLEENMAKSHRDGPKRIQPKGIVGRRGEFWQDPEVRAATIDAIEIAYAIKRGEDPGEWAKLSPLERQQRRDEAKRKRRLEDPKRNEKRVAALERNRKRRRDKRDLELKENSDPSIRARVERTRKSWQQRPDRSFE